ncbi:MAG: XisI protein [Chitinophagales bacterium]
MDRITFFQNTIIRLLNENADYYKGTTNPLNVWVLKDLKGNHFQLLMQGWHKDQYVFQCLLHLDIINHKIWIQWNDTDLSIEEELVREGVQPNEIVLGLKHPSFRKHTDFAIA